MKSTQLRSDAVNRLAFFAALCLFLSTIEYLIPKPVPFMRLGIANMPIVLALSLFPVSEIFVLVFLKVLGQALVTGTLFSYVFVFSCAGSFASALFMLGLKTLMKQHISLVGLSVAGALASNAAQIVLARFMLFGEGAWLIGPPMIGIGTVSGFLLGLFVQRFHDSSEWIKTIREERT